MYVHVSIASANGISGQEAREGKAAVHNAVLDVSAKCVVSQHTEGAQRPSNAGRTT